MWALVEEADLGWIYLQEDMGSLQPAGLMGCAGIEEVYENETVTIYRIVR